MRTVRHKAPVACWSADLTMTRASTAVRETRGRLDELSCSVRAHTWIADERAREDHAIVIGDGLPSERLGDSLLLPARCASSMRCPAV
jgi:hypothetical protein